ncbi:MAG: primosomal protein N' [Chloroflexi bacterium RBG_16_48_8]|nr:MAG: primosomal protein N' [Chloroflexi bacterium RBG_16_48_8]
MMFVEIAVNLPPVRGTFHYHIPPELEGIIRPGHLITATFGRRKVQGVVLALSDTAPIEMTRPIELLVDPIPVLTPPQLELARWMHLETKAPLIECITLMIPPGLSQQADSIYQLLSSETSGGTLTERRLMDLLSRRGPLRGRQIQHALPHMDWRRAANKLLNRGILSRTSILDPAQVHPHHVRIARLAIPPNHARVRVHEIGRSSSQAAVRRNAIVELLIKEGEPIEVTWVYAETGANLSDLKKLEEEGIVLLSQAEVWRDPLEQMDFIPSLQPELTSDQASAWEKIKNHVHHTPFTSDKPFLLHGVTGSGKTEIYLRAVAETLSLGRGAIILVPEISLTPQTVRRFVARFPGQVGLIHSQLSRGERYDTWRRCRSGILKVVVGPRSALFTPMPDIGLIVLDEAHDETYKEEGQAPRYHARHAALMYAKILNATCILGSATPDVTTMYQSEEGEMDYLSLPQRILGHRTRIQGQAARLGIKTTYKPIEAEADFIDLPKVRVVDMRQELKAGNRSIFSRPLQKALNETLLAGHQAILFLNRRGTSTYIFCRDCGEVLKCPRCGTALTYHHNDEQLRCHHCGYRRGIPKGCSHCHSTRIKYFGTGTQSIENAVEELLPNARTIRWDWDTTRSKGSHDIILANFASHRADILIGTQMIAKGLDLPLVTLVGIISADTGLNLPDYRASERTFQILTQVAGRAGRGLLGGHVILQTYQPDHYVIQAASQHDYLSFYRQELQHRLQLSYPPFRRLARLLYKHHSPEMAEREAHWMAKQIRARIASLDGQADLIGPVPCFFMRIRGEYRWHLILRALDPGLIIPEEMPEGWIVDIDPVSLL